MFTSVDLETMQWVNQAFNPRALASPGKIFPTPRTCGESKRAMDKHAKKNCRGSITLI